LQDHAASRIRSAAFSPIMIDALEIAEQTESDPADDRPPMARTGGPDGNGNWPAQRQIHSSGRERAARVTPAWPAGPSGQPTWSEDMSYIDGFVIAVPTANRQKFIEHARQLDPIFIELGAIRVIEGWGDDVPDGKLTDFRRAVQATPEETVAFSWVEWPDKATRDAGMKKMMDDPRMDPSAPGNAPMPFDGKRMIFGGFEQVVEVKA
jgi:uncharacterized protein YbaA (DUF1428 family)